MEIVLFAAILAAFAAGFFLIGHALKNRPKEGGESLLMLQNQIAELNRTLDKKLSEAGESTRWQLGKSAEIIREVTERLTKHDETNRQVVNFADQLKNLQDILKNPKQRGILGEYYLETVLKNVLPPNNFKMQYEFNDGLIVDAAIFVGKKIIPVDSKFSLENYNRLLEASEESEKARLENAFRQDLKNRIDETSKYVKPAENTMDFAFMFIPSEAVFYDVLINKVGTVNARDLVEYAFNDKRVIIVSPTSFFAYLQTVLQGLKALQIEESAKEIRYRVEDLSKHLVAFDSYMNKLGTHLGTAINSFNTAHKELGKIDKDILKITGEAMDIEPKFLERPETEEE